MVLYLKDCGPWNKIRKSRGLGVGRVSCLVREELPINCSLFYVQHIVLPG